ncbi:hypothetical protein QYE76_026370 [Lolium multiflorum]|uniref:C2H2-type domain-containing protein n=1 Tax=Lolium multiflorum TaxID=4521 RepID=A0AAD8VXW9_LOLMU|nr:hypothetical protein QYE76_026370 [Lolium multiflorum]
MELGDHGTKGEGGRRTLSGDDNKQQRLNDDSDDEGTRQPYNCTFCRRGFPTAQALGGHMNIHRKDRGRASTPPKVAEITLLQAQRAALPQLELRLFESGHVADATDRGKEQGSARYRRKHYIAMDSERRQEEEDEELDLELRLGW